MKASLHTLAFLVIIANTSFSQNYQALKSNEVNYFMSQDQDYILASRVDSIELQGTDSVFYNFQTMREVIGLPITDPCKYYKGASWMGPKTLIKANGQNVFYNWNFEPITLETQAELNDTFVVYTYPTGDWIKGVVSEHTTISVFDDIDSVKVIDLFSNVQLDLDNPRFVLSKNYGIVEQFAAYNFPEPYIGSSSTTGENNYPNDYKGNFEFVGMDNMGITKPTLYDINGFEIGDKVQLFSYSNEADGTVTELFTQREVINKFIWYPDSVVYFVYDSLQQKVSPPMNGQSTTTAAGGLISISYLAIDTWNTPLLPEEFVDGNTWTTLFINDCGDLEEVVRKQSLTWSGVNACLTFDFQGSNLEYHSIVGVGDLAKKGESLDGLEVYDAGLVFYERYGGATCGNKEVLSNEESQASLDFQVYPNPATDIVQINVSGNEEAYSIDLFDYSGKLVLSRTNVTKKSLQLDVSELNCGLYLVQIENAEVLYQEKLIKN